MNIHSKFPTSDRDLRLHLFLGVANWSIFLDHIPDDAVNLITARNYGFSGAADLFIFISGYTACAYFGKMMLERGFIVGATRILKRAWHLYAAYLVLFVSYIALISYVARQYAAPDIINDFNLAGWIDHPIRILAHGLFLQSRPLNLDVLQLYTLLTVFLAPVLWLMLRLPNVVMIGSIALYAAARQFDWNLSSYPAGDWYFNPFCWQLLFVFGGWLALGGARRFAWTLKSRFVLDLGLIYLAFALVMMLAQRFPALGDLFSPALLDSFNPDGKVNLPPYRLLHFVVVVFMVTRFVPKDSPWLKRPLFDPLIKCGEQSLAVFCIGVFLSFIGHVALTLSFGSLTAQVMVSLAGIAIMTLVAYYISWSKQQDVWKEVAVSDVASSAEHGVGQPQRQDRHIGDDRKHDQKQDQKRQDAADHLADWRRRDGGEHEQVKPDRRVDQPDLHVVGEDN
jgi:hypothetical protein